VTTTMEGVFPQRLLAWYGDDFTGSTDVLEGIARLGFPAVLFLGEVPEEMLQGRFADYRAFGIAGSSRSQSPEWMDAHLPTVFARLRGFGCRITHYKTCSTFDSSPEIGSIGRAMELGRRTFGDVCVPVIAGMPALGRYTAFGNLFAASGTGSPVMRIDRHPMSRHPVTPMREADLRVHLSLQTALRIGLLDLTEPWHAYAAKAREHDAVLIDVLNSETLAKAGRVLWESGAFAVGSSGVEYALAAWWRESGWLPETAGGESAIPPAHKLLVLSGSCSPVTARQIRYAGEHGFELVKLDPEQWNADAAGRRAIAALDAGRSVVLYSAMDAVDHLPVEIAAAPGYRERLARQSGEVLASVLDACPDVRRVVVAGGDTSSHAGSQLAIDALTFLCPVTPGAPLCRAWSVREPRRDGIEIVFKGGQCGADDFFLKVKGE